MANDFDHQKYKIYLQQLALSKVEKKQAVSSIELIWLEANIYEQEKLQYSAVIKSIFQKFHVLTSIQEYEKFLRQFNMQEDKKFFLIVTGSLGKQLMQQQLFHSEMILKIFIFCQNVEYHRSWSQAYYKVKAVENNFSNIKDHLLIHTRSYRHDDDVFKHAFRLNNIEACSEYVLFDFILQLFDQKIYSEEMKTQRLNDLIEYTANYFSKNNYKIDQEQFSKYMEYISKNKFVLGQYLNRSFLYEMISQTLSENCLSSIFKIRYIIYLLYHQLKVDIQNTSNLPNVLYRGACISIDDFDQWKQSSNIIFLKGFTSLTQSQEVAQNFIKLNYGGFDEEARQKYCKVLIKIDTTSAKIFPLAVCSLSKTLPQDEYLTQFNTFLSVKQVQQQNGLWVIWTKLCSFKDIPESRSLEIQVISKQNDQILNEKGKNEKIILLKLLWNLERVHDYLKLMQEWIVESTLDMASRYYCLSNAFNELGQYEEAHYYSNQSLTLKLKTLGQNHEKTANSIQCVGSIYQNIGSYPNALKYYEESLQIYQNIFGKNHINMARNISRIGLLYFEMCSYQQALEKYQKSLQIYKNSLGEKHAQTATSYNNIGVVYYCMGNYQSALDSYNISNKIYHETIGEFNSSVAKLYYNVGQVYLKLTQYEKALEFHKRSLQLKLKIFGEINSSTAYSYNSLGLVYYNLGIIQTAHEYYGKSLYIQIELLGEDHLEVATIYHNIGLAYAKSNNQQALQYLKSSLQIKQKSIGEDNYNITNCLNSISLVNFNMNRIDNALKYQNMSLQIYLNVKGELHQDTANCYLNIARIYSSQNNFQEAMKNYENCYNIFNKLYGPNHEQTKQLVFSIKIMKQKILI